MLEPELCRVLEAEDGESALRRIQLERDAIDVVVTDLVMPGIDGFDIVEVLADRPGLPVVCMAGLAAPGTLAQRLTIPFVPTPFTTEALRHAVAPLLRRSQELPRESAVAARRAAARWAATMDLVAAARERWRADGGVTN